MDLYDIAIARKLSGGSGGGGGGESWTTLTEETVTTSAGMFAISASLSYSQHITADTARITFDGVQYECEKIVDEYGNCFYGAYSSNADKDWSEYPFTILSMPSEEDNPAEVALYTETAGTYTVKIEVPQSGITP